METEALLEEIKNSINKTDDFNAAIKNLLQIICRNAGWNYGEAWFPNKSGDQMIFLTAWDDKDKIFKKYKKFNSICKFAQGVGLVGRTWKEKNSIWLNDIKTEPDFLRMEAAEKAGLKSAFSLPISINDKTSVIIIFFILVKKENDEELSQNIAGMCDQIGNFLRDKFFSN